jgi:hypothetical protein
MSHPHRRQHRTATTSVDSVVWKSSRPDSPDSRQTHISALIDSPQGAPRPSQPVKMCQCNSVSRRILASVSGILAPNRVCGTGELRIHVRGLSRGTARPRAITERPDCISLPRDESGCPITPKSRFTALVEAQQAWHIELGQSDKTTGIIVCGLLGLLVMLKLPLQPST